MQNPTARLSINSFYCVTQYVNSISTKSWLKKIRNSSLEFTVYFIWCPCFGSVTLKKHCGPQSHPWQGVKQWTDGNIIWRLCRFHERPSCKSGKCKVWSVRNRILDVIWYKKLDIVQHERNITQINMIFRSNAPILVFELLVQLELVVNGAHSSNKLLVLPGIGCGDAVGPHGEERDGTCSNSKAKPQSGASDVISRYLLQYALIGPASFTDNYR